MSIGDKIDEIKGGMTYQEFSKAIFEKTGLEIHWTALQKYITGKRNPSLKTLEILSRYAGVPVSNFIPETNKALKSKLEDLEKLKSLSKLYSIAMPSGFSERIERLPIISDLPKDRYDESINGPIDEYFIQRNTVGWYVVSTDVYKGEQYVYKTKETNMIDVGIYPGDLLFIRRDSKPQTGSLVLAKVFFDPGPDNIVLYRSEVVCKRVYYSKGPKLEPSSNPLHRHPFLKQIRFYGTVTRIIRELE